MTRSSVLKGLSATLLGLALTSCGSVPPPVPTIEPLCAKITPLSFALKPDGATEDEQNLFDTDETALAVDAQNRKLEALCS